MSRGYAVLLGVLACAWLAGRAHALLGERGMELGRALAALAPAGTETAFELNGQRLRLASLSLRAPSSEVVRRFAAACAGTPRPLVLQRELADRAGVALCLADWRSPELRYLYVQTDANGLSHVLLASSEGELRLRGMFPARGDAAGSDLPDVPRPMSSRRLLSARVPGRGYGFATYQLHEAPQRALERYCAELERSGFRIFVLSAQLRAAVRGERRVILQSVTRGGIAVTTLPEEKLHE